MKMILHTISKQLASTLFQIKTVYHRCLTAIGINRTTIRGQHNQLINRGIRANVTIKIVGDDNLIEIGDRAVISNFALTITGSKHRVIIGERCIFKRGSIDIEGTSAAVIIGNNTTIEGASFAVSEAEGSITVGEDCMLSNGIRVRSSDSHSVIDRTTRCRTNYAKNISIGRHVWIGPGAMILKGVEIGASSIIGAGAVVTDHVPEHCIAAGNPARIVREDVDWTRELLRGDHEQT